MTQKKIRVAAAVQLAVILALAAPLSGLAEQNPNESLILVEDQQVALFDEALEVYKVNDELTETGVLEGNADPKAIHLDEESGFIYPALYMESRNENSEFRKQRKQRC